MENKIIAPRLSSAVCPSYLLPWLTHQGALTPLLKVQSGKDPHIQCIQQGWTGLSWWDRQVLALEMGRIFRREIVMVVEEKACWYARTLIPEACYALDPNFFRRLESGPLTPLIFNEPKVLRQKLFYYPIDKYCLEYYWASRSGLALDNPAWVRFSSFLFLKSGVFYLIEIFLSDLKRI
jgi:chorismate lyase